ncbi:MAG: FAD-dependent oxidoreductase [Malacoplasma sp.]
MKIIVIGINHAGTSAIRTLLEQNKEHEVTALDRNDNISFLGCGIALTVSGVVKDTNDLFYSNPAALKKIGANVLMNQDVKKIDRKNKIVYSVDLKTNKKSEFKYDKLIYAAGSWPISSRAENRNLKNVEICKLYQHALQLIEKANDPSIKSVTIVGAGYIGIELAEAYKLKGKDVHVIDFQKRILANYVDKEISDSVEETLKAKGIKLHLGQGVVAYEGKTHVTAIKTTKETIKTDLVIESIGFTPNHELLVGVKKTAKKAIIVDSGCKTSDPNIYAIGDVAAFYDAATKKHRNIALATNAVKSGIVSACQINGVKQVKLESVVGTNALCVFDKKIASTGLSEETAVNIWNMKVKSCYYEDNDRPEFMNSFNKVAIKIVYEEKSLRLVGAQILSTGTSNHSEWIMALGLAIQQGMNLFQIALSDVYFLPHLNKPFNFVLSSILKTLGFKYFDKK